MGYEYLDHTADIQVHAWGHDLESAFEQTALAMLNYMYDVSKVQPCTEYESVAEVEESVSLNRLLFNFLEEVLYLFSGDTNLALDSVKVLNTISSSDHGMGKYSISFRYSGEPYSRPKHHSFTEIKAVTYSNMKIDQDAVDGSFHIHVIFDI